MKPYDTASVLNYRQRGIRAEHGVADFAEKIVRIAMGVLFNVQFKFAILLVQSKEQSNAPLMNDRKRW